MNVAPSSEEKLEQAAKEVLEHNLVQGDGYTYVSPDVDRYPHQWLWDSCFHVMVNSYLNPGTAKKEFKTLMKNQSDSGFIGHMNYWREDFSLIDKFVRRYYQDGHRSSLTQTPLIAQALLYLQEIGCVDLNFIQSYLPRVKAYYDHLYETRRFEDDEIPLLHIIHSWESGIDNSPVYDGALGIKGRFLTVKWMFSLIKQLRVLKKCKWDMEKIRERDFFLYKDILFNCAFVQGYRALAIMFERLDLAREKKTCVSRADQLEKVFLKHLWNDELGLFFGRHGRDNKMDDVKSALSLIPLILDGLPQSKAHVMVDEHLLNEEEFHAPFPVPSVAMDESSYHPKKSALLWRGPTWININWFLIRGLQKHGFENEATELSLKTLKLVNKSGFREFYSPHTGKGMGAKKFGWSTLVVDLIHEKPDQDDQDYMFFSQDWRHIKKGGFG